MFEKGNDILQLAKDFSQKCDMANVWYSLTNETLLGAVCINGFMPWSIKFQVLITYKGYNRLRELFPQNIIDSVKDKYYQNFTALWVNKEDYYHWQDALAFLELKIVVPTTIAKIKKYKRHWLRFKNVFQWQKDNLNIVIDELLERGKYQGYFELLSRRQKIIPYWHQSIIFERKEFAIYDFKFKVRGDYELFLQNKFGQDYQNIKIPKEWNQITDLESN